jgi:hypothetical protein
MNTTDKHTLDTARALDSWDKIALPSDDATSPTPPPTPKSSPWLKAAQMALTVFGIVFALFALAAAKIISKDATKWLLSRNASPPPSSAASWMRYTLGSVSFDTPAPIVGPSENKQNQVAELKRDLIASVYEYHGTAYNGSLVISCARLTFAPGATYDLDAGIQGCVSHAAENLNDKNPRYTTRRVSIDGLDARRATYRPAAHDGVVVEILVIVDNEGIAWMFAAAAESKYAKDAQRVMDSIHIAALNLQQPTTPKPK